MEYIDGIVCTETLTMRRERVKPVQGVAAGVDDRKGAEHLEISKQFKIKETGGEYVLFFF